MLFPSDAACDDELLSLREASTDFNISFDISFDRSYLSIEAQLSRK